MKKMKKPLHGVRSVCTLGELVTVAYDISPNRAVAVKLISTVLGSRGVHLGRPAHSHR